MTNRFFRLFLFFFVVTVLGTFQASAQADKLPPFRAMQANGKLFNAEDLPKGKPILLVYFSPECEHCETLVKAFMKKAASFRKASVAMITYLPLEKLAAFAKTYKLAAHSNVYAGAETTSFFIRDYYNIRQIPFVALYTSKGDLVKSYERDVPLNKLAAQLAKLK